MSKRKKLLPLPQTARERCRRIFGDPEPPRHVWEPEFDYCDDKLQALATKDWRLIEAGELNSYYILNLVYHEPLQPELFHYLFPLCLAVWHETLLSDAYFSDDLYAALHRPYLWNEMMDAEQRQAVSAFIVDSMIERLKQERGFVYAASKTPAYTWFHALSSLCCSLPVIEPLWTSWWTLDHPGKAVSAMMYASCLIYTEGEKNPVFGEWTKEHGGGAPYLVEFDSIRFKGWLTDNLYFLKQALTADALIAHMEKAASALQLEPEGPLAARIAADARQRHDIITIQIEGLI